MTPISEYRAQARAALKGNWLSSVVFVLVYAIVASLISGATSLLGVGGNEFLSGTGSLVGTLIALPLTFGVAFGFLGQARGREIQLGDLFRGYNLRIWTTELLKMVYLTLWTLLLIVPGIIKYYSYAQTEFIMADNPELSKNAAIERSMQMMQGHKMRLFLLELSFIGWAILGLLCFGIGLLWVEAYVLQARAAFYEELKGEE